jgi:hypothetical protein
LRDRWAARRHGDVRSRGCPLERLKALVEQARTPSELMETERLILNTATAMNINLGLGSAEFSSRED